VTAVLGVLLVVVLTVAAWWVLHRVEAYALAKIPPVDGGPRLLPVRHLVDQGAGLSDGEFFVHLAQAGVRDHLLEAAREADAGEPLPDAVLELLTRRAAGGAR
jgi:hypothetical protein